MDLYDRWMQLWPGVSQEYVRLAFYRISSKYAEPHRAYHTLQHVEACLKAFDQFKELATEPRAVEAALWWHDLIYDTHVRDNEQRSADIAQVDMTMLGCPHAFREHVVRLILATAHGRALAERDEQLAADIDLHPLGVSPARYKQDVTAIRKEYEWVPWEEYAKKRAAILQKFLDREPLFYLPPLCEQYERQAKVNLRREIAFLQKNLLS